MRNDIEIRDLTKNFGAVRALDGLDLTVRTGEVHGFLGPNGAGKSTTIRILLGLVKADGGSARLRHGGRGAIRTRRNIGNGFRTSSCNAADRLVRRAAVRADGTPCAYCCTCEPKAIARPPRSFPDPDHCLMQGTC